MVVIIETSLTTRTLMLREQKWLARCHRGANICTPFSSHSNITCMSIRPHCFATSSIIHVNPFAQLSNQSQPSMFPLNHLQSPILHWLGERHRFVISLQGRWSWVSFQLFFSPQESLSHLVSDSIYSGGFLRFFACTPFSSVQVHSHSCLDFRERFLLRQPSYTSRKGCTA